MTDDSKVECIEAIALDHAHELIAALRPSSSLWRPDPAEWVFRGHADASWRLLPSVNRRKSLRGFLDAVVLDAVVDLAGDSRYCAPTTGQAFEIVRRFARQLNASGREIPGGSDMLELLERSIVLPLHTDVERLQALGQHNGLPTMLLDWTRIGPYAAYFAAADAANVTDPQSDRLEVWALKTTILGHFGIGRSIRARLVTPPLGGNPNQHAQGGVFTVVSLIEGVTSETRPVELVPLDEIVPAAADGKNLAGPAMRRLSLPRRESGALLHWLRLEAITGASLYPGLDGVVRSVRERTQWG